MGCNASKNKVHIVGPAPGTAPGRETAAMRSKSGTGKNRTKKSAMGSQDSLGGMSATSENRHGSATSKVSKRTMDSGFDDSEYQRIITENSDPNLVRQVERGFDTPRDLGKGVSQRLSAKDKDRMESQRILAALHEEGLIQKPVAKTTAGVSFEVVADNAYLFPERRPPARLAKLEKTRKKKKKPMTMEQIEQKLAKAEERRKAKEHERLERIQDVSYKSGVQNALDSFQQRQEETDQQEKSKQDIAAENREKRLREMRDKLKAKQERIEAAKRRKRLAEINMEEAESGGQVVGGSEDESAFGQSKARITEDTVIQVKPNQYY